MSRQKYLSLMIGLTLALLLVASNRGPTVAAPVPQSGEVSLSIPIRANNLDGYEDPNFRISGDGYANDWVGTSTSVMAGWIFTNAQIPKGATILSSYVRFRGFGNGGNATARIIGFAEANAAAFAQGGSNKPSTRPITIAFVDWPNTWTYQWQWFQTPDLSAIIQEIINRSDWTIGNSIGFSIRNPSGTGTNWAVADYASGTYGGGGNHSVTLYIIYMLMTACYDFDRDGRVDVDDLQTIATRWHKAVGPPYNVDGDGWTTIADIMRVAVQWNQTCPQTGTCQSPATLTTWTNTQVIAGGRLRLDTNAQVWYIDQIGRLVAFNPGSNQQSTWGAGIGAPYDLEIDQGKIWYGGYNQNALCRLDPVTNGRTCWTRSSPSIQGSVGLARSQSQWWFAEDAGNALAVLNPMTDQITRYPLPVAASRPVRIAVAPDGNIWAVEADGRTLDRLNPSTNTLERWTMPTNSKPWDVLIDAAGIVWLAAWGQGIGRFDPTTEALIWYTGSNQATHHRLTSLGLWYLDFGTHVVYLDLLRAGGATPYSPSRTEYTLAPTTTAAVRTDVVVTPSTRVLTSSTAQVTATDESGFCIYTVPNAGATNGHDIAGNQVWIGDTYANKLYRLTWP